MGYPRSRKIIQMILMWTNLITNHFINQFFSGELYPGGKDKKPQNVTYYLPECTIPELQGQVQHLYILRSCQMGHTNRKESSKSFGKEDAI
jgi:hypothetical protein